MKKLLIILALLAWLPSAHSNDAEFNRGLKAHDSGDYKTALSIWQSLAEQGHAETQYNLGLMYYNGQGVPHNYEKALSLYYKSAKQGYKKAQNGLALLLSYPRFPNADNIQAYMWGSIAIANGNNQTKGVLSIIENNMTPAEIVQAQKLAKQCWESNYQNCSE